MKALTIAGGVTKDATTRTTQSGDKVTGFSVAVSEGFGDAKRTLYFDCSLWGKRGETLAQYLTKGSRVCVTGELSTREHDGKTYLTLRAHDVTLLGGGEQRQQSGGSASGARTGEASRDMDDEIPFNCDRRL